MSWDSGANRKFGQAWVRKRRCWLLTSRESSAFTIQQSVQVATTKNPVEKKAKKQAAYWRRSLIVASSPSGRDTWAAASPRPTQVAATLSGFWASATWGCEHTDLLLVSHPTADVLSCGQSHANRLWPTEGSWKSLSKAPSLQSDARAGKGLSVFGVGEKRSPGNVFCPDCGLMGEDGHPRHMLGPRWREGRRVTPRADACKLIFLRPSRPSELFSSPLRKEAPRLTACSFIMRTILICVDYLRQTGHRCNYAEQVLAPGSLHSTVWGRTAPWRGSSAGPHVEPRNLTSGPRRVGRRAARFHPVSSALKSWLWNLEAEAPWVVVSVILEVWMLSSGEGREH